VTERKKPSKHRFQPKNWFRPIWPWNALLGSLKTYVGNINKVSFSCRHGNRTLTGRWVRVWAPRFRGVSLLSVNGTQGAWCTAELVSKDIPSRVERYSPFF
jgi:hypothetical protein